MPDPDDPDVNDVSADERTPARTTATGYRSVSYFLPAALHTRLKAAWWGTREMPDGAPTLSALVERIFLTHVIELELEHNAGAAFPPAPRGAQGSGHSGEGYRYVAYYLPADLHARIKGAWWALRSPATPTLSSVVEALFTAEAERLELEHNAGAPFPAAPESARGVNSAAARRQGDWMRREWETRRAAAAADDDDE